MGVYTSRLSQVFGLSHCPHLRDKQQQIAHVMTYYKNETQQYAVTIIDTTEFGALGIIHLSWTFSLPYLLKMDSNLRDSKTPKITFRKRPLPVNNPPTHTTGNCESVQLRKYSELPKFFSKKNHKETFFILITPFSRFTVTNKRTYSHTTESEHLTIINLPGMLPSIIICKFATYKYFKVANSSIRFRP